MDNEIDRKIDVTAILFLLVQNRQQRYDRTLIGSGANGLGILEWIRAILCLTYYQLYLYACKIRMTTKYRKLFKRSKTI